MGRLHLSFSEPRPHDTVLHYANMGPRRLGRFQKLLQRPDIHLRHWCGGFGTPTGLVRAFFTNLKEQILRALRGFACTNIDRLSRHAILALSQIPDLLELPSSHSRNLVPILPYPPLLPQLDKSQADVMANR